MRNRRAVVIFWTAVSIGTLSACADKAPTEFATAEESWTGFGNPFVGASLTAAGGPVGLDGEFVRIAKEIPGSGGRYLDGSGVLHVVIASRAQSMGAAEMKNRLVPHLGTMGRDPALGEDAVIRVGWCNFLELNAIHRRVMSVLNATKESHHA